MKSIGSNINRNESFIKKEKYQLDLVEKTSDLHSEIMLGGGKKLIEAQHSKGKMTARERINLLIDSGTPFIELNSFAHTACTKNMGVLLRQALYSVLVK